MEPQFVRLIFPVSRHYNKEVQRRTATGDCWMFDGWKIPTGMRRAYVRRSLLLRNTTTIIEASGLPTSSPTMFLSDTVMSLSLVRHMDCWRGSSVAFADAPRNVTCWLGRAGEVEGSSGQNEVNNTNDHLSTSLSLSLLPSRRFQGETQSHPFKLFSDFRQFGLQKIYPLLRGKLPNASIASGSHLQPAKSPNLSKRPILFLSPGPFVIPYRGSSRRPADGRQLMQPNIRRPI